MYKKTNSQNEKDIVDKVKKNIDKRYKEYRNTIDGMAKAYKEVPGRKEYPKQTDPEKMSAFQLISDGYNKLEKEREREEAKSTKTIDFYNEKGID